MPTNMKLPGGEGKKKPSKIRVRAKLELRGKTATGFVIPEDVVVKLGSGRKPQVSVQIHGYRYRTSIASMGGEFMLPVSADVRTNAGVTAGDMIDIVLELDTEPREVPIPDDLNKALNKNAVARKYFETLSYSNKRRIVTPIQDAKTAETRQRRIEKAVNQLRDGKA